MQISGLIKGIKMSLFCYKTCTFESMPEEHHYQEDSEFHLRIPLEKKIKSRDGLTESNDFSSKCQLDNLGEFCVK